MDVNRSSIVCDAPAGALSTADMTRHGGGPTLAGALVEARERTLRQFAALEAALGPALRVPCTPELNLPLWELGHVGWFADWWIARNPQLGSGVQADPLVARRAARQGLRGIDADALYDSSAVPHDRRWQLDLPDAHATRADLSASLDQTLALLRDAPDDDTGLYFFRLALFHEDMHAEAGVYMAQALGIDVGHRPMAVHVEPGEASVPATAWRLGWVGPGFAFDNELGAHVVAVNAFEIDTRAVTWARYLPMVDAGLAAVPRYLRRTPGGWQVQRFGTWQALDLQAAACHLGAQEARAWCRWAGRRLPTEAEWEVAAHTVPGFAWGEVWEWTASTFAPFPGFAPHPYLDYSQPWFDGRPVLKGASTATHPRMRHPRYRNYFTAERNDIFAGFRSARA
ncbi:selenoneine synthase SenA [Hydrogenophaga sp.]|uniref:selenoneine synthase SenA n=1 Tax=Hydrogenophaga sp. TaxID=1904254 RepID=UPI0025C292A4|nr:selenoneine synthase SenA [Hydrogenophaga sp.]MBT9463261.1 SUMF1/EgtB/PvdO family nonheme iron enzyme [Hydrogenophaga sp.]